MNTVTVQFANGGFILTTVVDGNTTTTLYNSTGKVNKALRDVVAELSLLPKKSDADSDAE